MGMRRLLVALAAAVIVMAGWGASVLATGGAHSAVGTPYTGQIGICHATGSESNPFVPIHPDASGVISGHIAGSPNHQDGADIIPAFVVVDAGGGTSRSRSTARTSARCMAA